MFLQRCPGALPVYRKSGCYLYDICYYVNVFTNYPFSQARLNEIFAELRATGGMDGEAYVWDPERIFAYFGVIVEIRQDFDFHEGKPHHGPPDYRCKEGEFEISRWFLDESHFVCSTDSVPTYDSWGSWDGRSPNSKTVSFGTLVDKRIFRLVEVLKVWK